MRARCIPPVPATIRCRRFGPTADGFGDQILAKGRAIYLSAEWHRCNVNCISRCDSSTLFGACNASRTLTRNHVVLSYGSTTKMFDDLFRRGAPMKALSLICTCRLVIFVMAAGFLVTPVHAQYGPISAATAKAEGAKFYSETSCVLSCRNAGNKPPKACPQWCTPGQCYRHPKGPYCIK